MQRGEGVGDLQYPNNNCTAPLNVDAIQCTPPMQCTLCTRGHTLCNAIMLANSLRCSAALHPPRSVRRLPSLPPQLHWIRDHGRVDLSPGHSGQVKVVAEDLSEEASGDGGEEKGAKVDEGQTVEEGEVEQIQT